MLEFSQFDYAKDHKLSYSITCFVLPIIIVLTFLMLVHYLIYRDGSTIQSTYLSELYDGTKDRSSMCKLYNFIFVLRRLINALILVSLRHINVYTR